MHGRFLTTEEETRGILLILKEQRLIRAEPRGDEEWYELTHERLVPIIRQWIRVDRKYFNFTAAKDLIDNSSQGEFWRENPETLLNEGQLEGVIAPFQARLRLDQEKIEFLFWSAVYRRSGHLEYWHGRLDRATVEPLLFQFLSSGYSGLRRGAAAAIARLRMGSTGLLTRCVDLALHDQDSFVQRDAGAALAAVGSTAELGLLKAALSSAVDRPKALQVLADFEMAGRGTGDFGLLPRLRARRIMHKRLIAANLHYITARTGAGLIAGVVSGVLWAPTVGLAYAVLMWMLFSSASGPSAIVYFVGSFLVIGCLFGPVFGITVAWSATRRDTIGKRRSLTLDVLFSIGYVGIFLLYVIVLFAIYTLVISRSDWDRNGADYAMLWSVPLIFWGSILGAVWIVDRASGRTRREIEIAVWATICSFIVPLFVYCAVFWGCVMADLGNSFKSAAAASAVSIPVASCIIFTSISSLVVARRQRAYPKNQEPVSGSGRVT